MKEQLFKAMWRINSQTLLRETVGRDATLGTRIRQWLRDHDCSDHLINLYANDTSKPDEVDVVAVLTDRNTALMLKLAVE